MAFVKDDKNWKLTVHLTFMLIGKFHPDIRALNVYVSITVYSKESSKQIYKGDWTESKNSLCTSEKFKNFLNCICLSFAIEI